jgi:putative ABC transport system ATP-binding protein
MKGADLIRCKGVWKIYNEGRPHEVIALSDVKLCIKKGSITIFTGPSGSGKTTLMSIIGTIERPSRGTVYLDGRELTVLSDVALSLLRRRRIGFVFQDFNLIPRLPALKNVSYPLIPEGISTGERRKRAYHILDTLGLSERVNHIPEELSGGEQQRVAIARALVNDPDILILDEPTSNIDQETAQEIVSLLKNLKREGKTIILSTHDGDLIADADAVYKISKGRID